MKDKLHKSAYALSGGQQQRLCIARALAVDPEVLLLDEPCSALDPVNTAKIEELLFELKPTCTLVIVTHNMQQAARVSDSTAFMLNGDLIEFSPTGHDVHDALAIRAPRRTSPAASDDLAVRASRDKSAPSIFCIASCDRKQRHTGEARSISWKFGCGGEFAICREG